MPDRKDSRSGYRVSGYNNNPTLAGSAAEFAKKGLMGRSRMGLGSKQDAERDFDAVYQSNVIRDKGGT